MKKALLIMAAALMTMTQCKKDDDKSDGGGTGGGGTQTVATVTTGEVTEITQTTAVCGGNVTSDGGATVTARGVCWSTEPNPTPSDNCTVDGEGVGAFTSEMTDLEPGTKYYVRAYAKNAAGTGFGAERSFTTLENGGGGDGRFSVSSTTTVEFAPGNLYWDGSAFRFEANQWSFEGIWNENHVSHFYWSKTASVAYAGSYNDSIASTSDVFFTNASDFQVNGETAGTWRTLSIAEWCYLLGFDPEQWIQTDDYGRPGAKGLCAWMELDGGTHKGLVILPDGTDASVMNSITKTSDLATHGAVFLPAAGYRYGMDVNYVGSSGLYWSSTPNADYEDYAYYMYFYSGSVYSDFDNRYYGFAVRLVR